MKTHSAAKLFPPMSQDEFDGLKADIKAHGQIEPIILDEAGLIVDGRNRYRACRELKIEPKCKTRKFKGKVVEYVVSQNLHRRHLTKSQTAMVGRDMLPMLEKEAKERQRKHGGTAPGRKNTSGKNSGSEARELAGKATGVNPRYIQDAKYIDDQDKELANKVRSGEKTITQAKRQLKEQAAEKERKQNRRKVAKVKSPEELAGSYATIVIDPPWDYSEEGDNDAFGRTRPKYAQMSMEDVAKLPLPDLSAKNAHLYLWITNRSLLAGKAWELLETWGFRPITIITWCKPSIGIGNYFRNNTEHIVFGVRGKLSLARKNVGTWFQARRGPKGHSNKPPEFFEMVERCSPGPYLEMFSRTKRKGWISWGEDS